MFYHINGFIKELNNLKKYPSILNLARKFLSLIPLSHRLGKVFWDWYAFFEESEGWDLQKIEEFQFDQLMVLLKELNDTSIYYQNILSTVNFQKISSFSEFSNLVPTMTRSDFRQNYDVIINKKWKNLRIFESQTSGTTGSPLQFYHNYDDQYREWAAICHQWKRVGYIPGVSRRAEFRGLTINGKLIEFYPNHNMLRCSILHMKKNHIEYYAEEIVKNRIDFFHGYPSALYLLAVGVIGHRINFPEPKSILLASEMVYDWQIERIQEAFPNTKIFAHYGCAERTILGGWCEFRNEYHVLPQYSYIEFDQKSGEIIGTNLFNSINGFIRYRMTDQVKESSLEICPDCHRPYIPRLLDFSGRTEDFLFSPEKGWIPLAIVTYPLKSIQTLEDIQFVQEEKGLIIIKYISSFASTEQLKSDLGKLEAGLKKIFGNSMKFKFKIVDEFERGPTGKFKWIISKLVENPREL